MMLLVSLIALYLFIMSILMNQAILHINANGLRLLIILHHQINDKLTRTSIIRQKYSMVSSLTSPFTVHIDNRVDGLMIVPDCHDADSCVVRRLSCMACLV